MSMRLRSSLVSSAARLRRSTWRTSVRFRCISLRAACRGRRSTRLSALRFLYGVTLRRADLPERIVHGREPQKLPVVLSTEEVVRFLEAVPGLKCRAALTTAYAAGLRASEVASLKVADIDSSRMVIRVELGKGGRDRWTERLRRVELDHAIGIVGGQVYPFDPAGIRRPVGTSTKGDHHVAIT